MLTSSAPSHYCILSTSSTDFPFLNLTIIVYYTLPITYAVQGAKAEGLLGDRIMRWTVWIDAGRR